MSQPSIDLVDLRWHREPAGARRTIRRRRPEGRDRIVSFRS
jgi:hypothetical protein